MTRYRLIEFTELDSTNRHACAHLAELAHGDVIHASVQTVGRGRMERRWISHVPGNLCLSLVLKPDAARVAELPLANLSQLLALSACRVIDSLGAPATLKWPNDIQVGGRKIAGILAETVVRGSEFLGMVLGIGVNLNLDRAALATIDQPATSLAVELGWPVEVAHFRGALLDEFFARYEEFLRAGFGLVREEFCGRCQFLGRPVEVRSAAGMCRGTALDINPDGALLLRDTSGQTHVVTIGEMFSGGGFARL
jgi:BirA family transcriptional regulator, biotin operon repressor / biotin---[acetyl-CoA-carboxylase] ligase